MSSTCAGSGCALRGDLGESIRTREPVLRLVGQKLPITLQLAAYSLVIALLIAIPAGVLRGGAPEHGLGLPRERRVPLRRVDPELLARDHADPAASRCGSSWLPASGFVSPFEDLWGNTQRLLMPAVVLGTALAAVLMRQTRNSMIEVLSADYIRTAYAKGLRTGLVVFRHAIRNGLIPVITIFGLQMGALISGRRGHRADLRGAGLRAADRRGGLHAGLPASCRASC